MNEIFSRMPPTDSTGWIYVLENEVMPNLFKIGFTTNTVEQRVAELSNHTGVFVPFTCVFYCRVRNPRAVESDVHKILNRYRFNKEFFDVEFSLAIETITQVAAKQKEGFSDLWHHPKYTIDPKPPLKGEMTGEELDALKYTIDPKPPLKGQPVFGKFEAKVIIAVLIIWFCVMIGLISS